VVKSRSGLLDWVIVLVVAALAIRFAVDLILPVLPLLVGAAVVALVARWAYRRRNHW
jgi:hypothetical protein